MNYSTPFSVLFTGSGPYCPAISEILRQERGKSAATKLHQRANCAHISWNELWIFCPLTVEPHE